MGEFRVEFEVLNRHMGSEAVAKMFVDSDENGLGLAIATEQGRVLKKVLSLRAYESGSQL